MIGVSGVALEEHKFKLDGWDIALFLPGLIGGVVAGAWLSDDRTVPGALGFLCGMGLLHLRRKITKDPDLHYQERPKVDGARAVYVAVLAGGIVIDVFALFFAAIALSMALSASAGPPLGAWLVLGLMVAVGAAVTGGSIAVLRRRR
jgi:hypothetical protein